jgi:hypothetical protein
MPMCKFCGKLFSWGYATAEDKWVPLVPVGEEGGLDLTFQDEEGRLRASHRDICDRGGASVRVARLAKKVRAVDMPRQWTAPDEDGVVEPLHTEVEHPYDRA